MNSVNLNLEYCYGIKRLKTTFDFEKKRVVALYAQNGTMKTSLAETFLDLSKGVLPRDRIVPSHTTICEVSDENNVPLSRESIFVIRPLDEAFRTGDKVSTLLVNRELSEEYTQLLGERDNAKEALIEAVKGSAKSKNKAFDREISTVITRRENDFLSAMVRLREEVRDQPGAPFADVEYDKLFDPKGLEVLSGKDMAAEINGFVERYNKLLEKSVYFKKGTFDYYNAGKIAKALVDNGFFEAAHSLNLNAESKNELIKSVKELEAVIENEKNAILSDAKLKTAFDKVSKALTKNDGLRDFQAYLMNHEDYLSQIGDVNTFKENVIKSYLKANYDRYEDLLVKHDKVAERERVIRQEAINQKTLWSELIDTFNSRFFVPFRLVVENQADVLLGREGIKLGFIYKDEDEDVSMEEGALLKCLSQGERRAFYILQVLFEVSVRKKNGQETLLVIDDIADSFDYQNKYAILHYLVELSEDPLFKQIIMTHNFDFFRSIAGRAGIKRYNSFVAIKNTDGIALQKPEGIDNPFVNIWQKSFFDNDLKKIASICFIRNLVEYTAGKSDDDYRKLTCLVHLKNDSRKIKISELDSIFTRVCGKGGQSNGPDRIVIDVMLDAAKETYRLPNAISLEHKIVLSLACRILAEQYMIGKINDPVFVGNIKKYQTAELLSKYRSLFPASTSLRVLDRVSLMTPENIHLNSFMFEPIMDMSDQHLRELYANVEALR